MKKSYLALVMGLFVLLVGMSAWGADVPQELYFTKNTTLTASATYTFRFSLWDDETGGGEVWSEEKRVELSGTTIKTYLGDATLGGVGGVDFSQQYWVQVERRKNNGDLVPMGTKRTRFAVVPYAMWAVTPAGDTGPTGPQGEQGLQGIQGLQGDKGDKGDTGSAGADGYSVLSGAEDPDAETGVDGDFYINTASNTIFGPKAAGVWAAGTLLIGSQGDKGDTGDQGIQGVKGDTGDTGLQGLQGLQGIQGIQGDKGDKGDTGNQGIQGIQGIQGAKGDTGDQGIQGVKGDTGDTGATGATGPTGDTGPSAILAQAFSAGGGTDPSSSLAFLAPTASVTISVSGQKVHVNSVRSFGSSTGANSLSLSICYKETTGSITAVATSVGSLKVPAGTTVPMGLNAIISGLATGTYDVGLCGLSSNWVNWDDNNGYGYTSAFVFVTP